MGKVVLLASGSGTNFQAICERFATTEHSVVGLVCDRPGALVVGRAEQLGVPVVLVPYPRRTYGGKKAAEERIVAALNEWSPDLIVLAGFMRVLSAFFVDQFHGRIINIHPSLLPKYRGLDAIERSYEANDEVVGITVHFVDHGVDTGSIIRQESIRRDMDETLEHLESRIHDLEHATYPEVILSLLAEHDHKGRLEQSA